MKTSDISWHETTPQSDLIDSGFYLVELSGKEIMTAYVSFDAESPAAWRTWPDDVDIENPKRHALISK